MSQSLANVTPNNLELTPCRVTYKGVDLGGTSGNVIVKMEQALSDLKVDQYGSTVIDKRVSGFKYTVDLELCEVKNKDNWKILFPSAIEVQSGPNKSMYFDSQMTFSQRASAGELVLHPLALPDSDKSEDFYVWLAAAEAKSDWNFSPSEQVKLKLTFYVYPDFTVATPRFFIFGDPSVGLQPASAGTPATGANVGNGAMTDVAVYSGYTKTEVITAQCVTEEVNGGQFYVSGSQSGALGLAEVDTSFSSPVIGFTIEGGSIDFQVGDSFTVQTYAANYV